MEKTRILLIEDDVSDQLIFKRLVSGKRLPYEYVISNSLSEAKKLLQAESFDVVIADYMLGDGTALDILKLDLDTPVIILTGGGSEQVAVVAMKAGAYDYLIKDLEYHYLEILPITVEKAIRHRKAENLIKIQNRRVSEEVIIVGSGISSQVTKLVELAASTDRPVMITGETGTGKTLIAKAIHYQGSSKFEPFISINCAALPEHLIESELYGYEKGAFTDAVSLRKGLFEIADGGSLLLDEIGEMPIRLQPKLLSVLEDQQIRRLGSESTHRVNVRVIAATSIELERALDKTFRKDLYYRLSVIRIHIPPLRERRGDIPELCRHLLKNLTGKQDTRLSETELERLSSYDWPGNVRELRNILERAVICRSGALIRPSELLKSPIDLEPVNQIMQRISSQMDSSLVTLDEMEKHYIKIALAKFSGNATKSAQALGISLSTIKRKIKQYGLK